jgi:uncharacterized membrane protein
MRFLPIFRQRGHYIPGGNMEARANLLGHPVHQMLIVLPLGLLTGAVAFDVVNLVHPGPHWNVIAYWLIVGGVAGGLLAAVFGFADWTKIPSGTRAKSVGATHGIGNVIVVALFTGSWLLRHGNQMSPSSLALLLSFAGAGVSLITGWLGGELVTRLGIGVTDGAHVDAPSSLSGRPARERV